MTARTGSSAPTAVLLALAGLTCAALSLLHVPATAEVVGDPPTAARAASTWLAGQASAGVLTDAGQPDWGLTADSVFAHAAAGNGATAGAVAADRLEANIVVWASPSGGAQRLAGPLAKALVVAAVAGRDPANFGGWNVRAELLALMDVAPGSTTIGRFRSVGPGDGSNGFSQALAVIGLARTGTVPAEAVSYLLGQQCPNGGFRLFFTGGATCTIDAQADPDTTGLVVQALLAPGAAGSDPTLEASMSAAVGDALDWLEARQQPDGSFVSAGPTGSANSNSTALAAQGLRAGGRIAAADRATAWVRSVQLGCSVVIADRGAFAFDATGLADTLAGSAIPPVYRDQFRRSTAQAVLGLGGPSFLELSTDATSAAPGTVTCLPTTSTTTAPSTTAPSTTAPSTTAPGATTVAPTTAPTTTAPTTTAPTTAPPAATSGTAAVVGVNGSAAVAVNATPGVQVEGTTVTARSTAGSSLAVTGRNPLTVVAVALLVSAMGVATLGLRSRRG